LNEKNNIDYNESADFDCFDCCIGSQGEVLCDRCAENAATLDCEQCKVPFCDNCSRSIHQKGKWATHALKRKVIYKRERKREREREGGRKDKN
jgi:hypothetical protein